MVDIISKYSPIPLTAEQLGKMRTVYEKLEEKNKVMNLTSIKSAADAAELHFIDSLYPLSTGLIKGDVLDVGSGGGFPGIPVAIASDTRVTCLDATKKKLDFIEETASETGIGNIGVLYGRAEELALDKACRDKYDTVLSRGVARLNVLCEWCLPYLKPNGYFIAMKGSSAAEEAQE
ncbi:MAG: 16S rRNA (guanine(527)-N(7))-methyltransferase RsmG, partial [Victivallales bacterium]